MTLQKRNIFIYWTGKEYKLISILRNLIYIHSTNGIGYHIILITPENIHNYVSNIPNYFYNLLPAHQADYVRVNVICDYGGIWLDSDTLVLDSLDSLFDIIDNKDGFLIKQNNNILWNGIFGSKKGTCFMKYWKNKLRNKLDITKGKIGWCDIGNDMLEGIFNSNPGLFKNYKIFQGLDNVYPVNWDNCVTEFITKPYDNYKNIIRNYQPFIVLVNSVYKALENKHIHEILNGTMPINYFINKSFDNSGKTNYFGNRDPSFIKNLNLLNLSLKYELEKNNVKPVLLGNLFYDHDQTNPPFYNSKLLKDCEEKRERLSKASKKSKIMFEIGLNGGHSSFLALNSNKNLKIYANDIAEHYPPCPHIHPEIYVNKAASILKKIYKERFIFIEGSCLIEVPKFVQKNIELKIDLVHIHGTKHTYEKDFYNIMPLLKNNALVIFDDSNMEYVQKLIDKLIVNNYLFRLDDFPQMKKNIKYRNEILLFKKKIFTQIKTYFQKFIKMVYGMVIIQIYHFLDQVPH